MPETSPDPAIARAWKLMRDIRVCMLASHEGGVIRARPMDATPREEEHAVYFLTSAGGHKDDEIKADDGVCLAFAKPDSGKYLCVTGRARVITDRVLIRNLWTTAADAWWKGPEDLDVVALEVTPQDAQYWEGPHGVVATVAMIAAAATGGMPLLGDQRKVDMN